MSPLFYATNDGGRTWHEQLLPAPVGLTYPASVTGMDPPRFFDARHGAAAVYLNSSGTPDVVTCYTDDKGATWTDVRALPRSSTWAVFDDTHQWTGAGGELHRSADHSRTTHIVGTLLADEHFVAMQFIDEHAGIAIAQRGSGRAPATLRTTDGGMTWSRLSITTM